MAYLESLLSQLFTDRPSLIPVSGVSQSLLPLLAPGQLVRGEVLSNFSPQQFLVQIQGEIVQAQSTSPLPVGAEISLKVEALSPQIVFSLFPEGSASTQWEKFAGLRDGIRRWNEYSSLWEALLRNLSTAKGHPQGGYPAPAVRNLQDLLTSLPLKEPGSMPLRLALASSGLFYESTIFKAARDGTLRPQTGAQDLKGALLRYTATHFADTREAGYPLRGYPEAGGPWGETLTGGKEFHPAGHAARQLLNLIELYQVSNAARENGTDSFTFPLAFASPGGLAPAYLRLEVPHRKGRQADPRPVTLLLYLTLSSLGSLRVDGLISDRRVSLSLAVESEEAAAALRRGRGALRERLAAFGFRLEEFLCRVSPRKVEEASKEVSPLHWLGGQGLLDVRI
ncbi:MAG: flagellar hook-length control protein FliK [Candidatus Tectomicrobia bacterium]|uniref:Flagellar hook-length control protein FliK n=1 Tax=Tectimicrobiota bacterium TaxID=2528274 RepID=A0A932GN33_UNCTE|nr:flagellar hook-length control protein FliK [Candidatus Tectomicrobia bacterium]